MSKCKDCRKVEAESTWWERKRYQLMQYLFAEDVINLVQEKYTQGFGDGLKQGFKDCMNINRDKETVFREMLKEGLGTWLQPFDDVNQDLTKPLL